MVRHRVRAEAVLVVVSGILPQIPFVPILAVLVLDVEALVRQVGVLWDVDLDVTASFKLKRLTVLNLEHELLDERGDVVVRAHFAPELFDPEDLLRDADLHVFFDLDLARKPPVLFGFFAIDVTRLRREQITAPFEDLTLAHGAGAAAAAGGGEKDLGVGHRRQEVGPGRDGDRAAGVTVDLDAHLALRNEALFGGDQTTDDDEHDRGKGNDCDQNFHHVVLSRVGCRRRS